MSDQNKEDYVVDFIKALKAIEDEMEPYKEHKRDLRKNYVQNGWLTGEEMRQAVRAYRMLSKDDDISQFTDYFEKIKKMVTGV
jgi:hypothetical protein|tara:strand:- start:1746 stop:1994 length:249 start_codon:yes stop_codon:yes gene_type:complete